MSLLLKVVVAVVGLVALYVVLLALAARSPYDSISGTSGAGDVLLLWLVVGAASGVVGGRLARDKGHDFIAYLIGFFLPFIGVVVSDVAPDRRRAGRGNR